MSLTLDSGVVWLMAASGARIVLLLCCAAGYSPMISENQAESAKLITGTRPSIEPSETSTDRVPSGQGTDRPATVIVRGETVSDQQASSGAEKAATDSKKKLADTRGVSETKEKVSEAKLRMRSCLPALDDDGEIGVQKEHLVTRDGKADLTFTGTLLASAAQGSTSKDSWEEYRIYATTGGKHVFSKLTRSVLADEPDRSEAEVFDPSPSSVPSQLLRSARDLTRSHPIGWTDAAVSFFGYNAPAKALYRKLGDQFNEHIS